MATGRPVTLPPEAAAHALSTAALAVAVRRPQAGPELLRETIRRVPGGLRQTLETIAADPQRPADVRTIAVVGLSTLRDGRSIGALLVAAKSGDAGLARRAVEALGRLGTATTLAELRRLRVPPGPAARGLAFARSLVAYRHGIDGERLALPPRAALTTIDPGRAVALPVARLAPQAWSALKPTLQGAEATLAPTERPPIEIRCGTERLLLMVNPQLDGAGAGRALGRPLVAAVLMKHSPTLARWYVAEYVFAHPARDGTVQLIGARPTGSVVHGGSLSNGGAAWSLNLQALDSPLAAPSRITATLGGASGVALQARVEPDRSRNRNLARRPRAEG
jgi:hypothetical protein